MLYYVCSLFAFSWDKDDAIYGSRPHVPCTFNGVKAEALIDTGASISCVSEELFRSIPGHWNLPEAPIPYGFSSVRPLVTVLSSQELFTLKCAFWARFSTEFSTWFAALQSVQP